MWLCNIQGILLLICLSHVSTSARSYADDDREYLQRDLINMLKKKFHLFSPTDDDDSSEMDAEQYYVDPDDHVDVARWNQLNDEDIKHMPVTEDYSNEQDAMTWLRWHSRISVRYQQVRPMFITDELAVLFVSLLIIRPSSDQCASSMEP